MTRLEDQLGDLADELRHPPTPSLADAVGERLRRERRPFRPGLRTRRGLAVVLATTILVPAAVAAAVPSLRHAVLDFLDIRGAEVVRTPTLPPARRGAPDLGARVGLGEAARRAGFRVVVPRLPELPPPDAIYFRATPPGGAVSFVYAARPRLGLTARGLVLTEFRGTRAEVYLRKVVGPDTTVEPVRVRGEPGVWLAGRPHEFAYADAHGRFRTESLRLAGDTLVWQNGPLTLRLGGASSKVAALRIADSVR